MANIIFLGRLGRESFKGTEFQDSRTARIQLLDIYVFVCFFFGESRRCSFLFFINSFCLGECVFQMEVGNTPVADEPASIVFSAML